MDAGFERHGFRFRVASRAEDATVAELLNATAIPGWIGLSYRTEPGRHAPLWEKAASATILGTRITDGTLGGMATRSVLPGFLEGRETEIGWLGQLRIAPEFRHRPHLLKAGFDAVRGFLHEPDRTPWHLASIIDGNTNARRILERGLLGFPRFESLFPFRTLALSTGGAWRFPPSVRSARPDEMRRIADFVDGENRDRDFAPRLDGAATDFTGLQASDFLIRESGGELAGVAAVWDQRPFRSLLVTGYREPLRTLRPLANMAAPPLGLPHLPPPGRALRQVYLSLAAVRGDDAAVWHDLVRAARTAARRRGADLIVAGFAAGDAAADLVARRFRHRRYDSTIYRVFWEEERCHLPASAPHRPKIEIGLL